MLLRPTMTADLPRGSTPEFFNQTHHTERCARDKALFAGDESTRIGYVKAVDVFGRVNC